VVPRPIALVTTLDENGKVNAAPFSFFTCSPKIPACGARPSAQGRSQPQGHHAQHPPQRAVVVHMVDEALAATMNDCAIDFPSGNSEVEATGLETLPSGRYRRTAVGGGTFRAGVQTTCRTRFRPGVNPGR